MPVQLEIACFNIESALIAQKANANRIELCDGFEFGGTTPTSEMLGKAQSAITTPWHAMIRPRGGDFCYSDEEFLVMKESIKRIRNFGASGFVFGILNSNGNIDVDKNKELVDLANGLPCTMHRAVDRTKSYSNAISKCIECGFTTILSSGSTSAATNGLNELEYALNKYGTKINIMPGGGIRSSNALDILNVLNANWIHSSGIIQGTQCDYDEVLKLKNICSMNI